MSLILPELVAMLDIVENSIQISRGLERSLLMLTGPTEITSALRQNARKLHKIRKWIKREIDR